ncbi:acetate--CoA ligase family protein (plasmid) [Rhizobium leguminosarum]
MRNTGNHEGQSQGMYKPGGARLRPIVNPASVALIGVSSKPGSAGQLVLGNLLKSGYRGAIHLVGRSGGTLDGRAVLTDITQLPAGVDLAILMVPAAAVLGTLKSCIDLGIPAAVCFASGFAEMGEEGRRQQIEIGEVARAGGLALLGPNTVGYYNYVDGFHLMMVPIDLPSQLQDDAGPAIAIAAQSGGIGVHLASSLEARGVPISYMLTTGNEADIGLAEVLDHYADDPATGAVIIYAEQIRSPSAFVAAAKRARAAGKGVVLLHPGKSEKAQVAAQSHTGALAGNHAVIRLMAERAGVVVVDSLEEAIDIGQLLLRFPQPPVGGLALVTGSGAVCGIAQDYAEPLGLDMPPISDEQAAVLREHLPEFLTPRNPLDLGTAVAFQPQLLEQGIKALLHDASIGSLLVCFPHASPSLLDPWLTHFLNAIERSTKPVILTLLNEDVPLPDAVVARAKAHGVVLMRSPERAIRALAGLARTLRQRAALGSEVPVTLLSELPSLGKGPTAEWRGKEILRSLGIKTPEGGLVRNVDEAVAIAARIGYPVVIKAQAASLMHKSEVGGVLVGIRDETGLREAWQRLHANVAKAKQDLVLDGVLVEAMGERGLELIVGANRDAQWGPTVMVGLGGIWTEVLADVKLLPADLQHDRIVAQLRSLRASKLLTGYRGAEPVDLDAVADAVAAVGRLMLSAPQIAEIDINPLVAYGHGKGAVALDALIVTT